MRILRIFFLRKQDSGYRTLNKIPTYIGVLWNERLVVGLHKKKPFKNRFFHPSLAHVPSLASGPKLLVGSRFPNSNRYLYQQPYRVFWSSIYYNLSSSCRVHIFKEIHDDLLLICRFCRNKNHVPEWSVWTKAHSYRKYRQGCRYYER